MGQTPVDVPDLPLARCPIRSGFGSAMAPPDPLGRLGSLEVRLARSGEEIAAAQALRYRVFYDELSAAPDAVALATRRDEDRFDALCDHLLVLDHADMEPCAVRRSSPRIVGTYRLLRQEVAAASGGFYSAGEFEVAPVLERHPGLRFLELGRSCVLPPYRTKRTVELLWHGIWAYVLHHGVDVMMGCASLEGTDPERLALPLSFLHHFASAGPDWQVRARPELRIEMDRMGREAIDPKAALRALPPLVKGYLRLGASIGDGAAVDYQFGTTDVMIVLPVAAISSRYIAHYGADAGRHAA